MPNLNAIIAAGAAAGVTMLLSPDRGKARRALIREKGVHLGHKVQNAAGKTRRDVANRSRGILAEARSFLRPDHPDDDVLEQRVRSILGRHVSHAGSLEVDAVNGHVTLMGPILADEVEGLLESVEGIRGVRSVANALDVHETAENVPGLQGGGRVRVAAGDLAREEWSPTLRLLVGSAGAWLALSALRRGSAAGALYGGAGLGMLIRATANQPLRRITGVGAHRKAVWFNKTVTINAPVEKVFAAWSNFENFPYFMRNVIDVRKIDDRRSRWTVRGPAGAPVEWTAGITRLDQNQAIAWKTEPDALVQHAGVVHFSPAGEGATRADITFSYNPGAGAAAHLVARLFGVDPKSEMDEDLVRMKTFLETGKAPRDAQRS